MPAAASRAQNSEPATPKVVGRPFEPGQSGNPGGRPKGLATKIRELAPAEELAGFYLALWTRDGKVLRRLGIKVADVTLAERTKAADWLADRGYGKAPQYAAVEGEDPLELTDPLDLSIEAALDELAARREAQAAGADAQGDLARASTG